METRAGDPGAFAHFDLTRVPSPAFVVDAAKIRANLAVLRRIGDASGARVLAALKAFSMWSLGDTVAEYLDGVCASGLYEARLGREEYGGPNGDKEVATYCAGYKEADKIGRASWRDRVCQYVSISEVAVQLKKQTTRLHKQ